MLKQLFFTLALMGSLAALCSSTQAQKMARDGDSGLSPHAADTIVKNFLAAQRSHEESTQEQGSAIADPGILQAPKAPMSHEQIVAALKELSKKSGVLLVDEINRFVPVYKEQHKDDKNDPFMELVDAFNSDHGGDALPGVNPDKIRATEKQDKEALALVCVQYAVQGLEPQ